MTDRVMKGSNKGNAQLRHYGVAIASVALALGLTRLLLPWIYPTTTPLFFIAVMVSAWYGGRGSGLLATVLSTLAINYFFIKTSYPLDIADIGTIARLGMFLIAAGVISSLNQSRRSALHQARATLQTLQEAMEREQAARSISETAQTAATAAKAQLETVLSSINDGFYVLDRNWCFTYVNDRLCEMTGMPRSAMLGQSLWDLFSDAVGTDVYIRFQQAMREQTPTQFEYFYAIWNRWYEIRLYFSPTGMTVLVTDISEAKRDEVVRKQAEAEVQTQRQLLETVANYLPNSVAIVRGRDLTFQFVNPMYQAIAPGKQMVGRTVQEVWPETQPHFADRCRHVLETGEPYHAVDEAFEVSRTGDGLLEPAYFSWSMHRVNLPDENGWGLLITVWETTDRKQSEAALRQSEERYRTLFESIDDGFCIIEVLFDETNTPIDYRFLEVNPAFEKQSGLEQVVGKTARQVIPGHETYWYEIYGKVVLTGEPICFENGSEALNRWFEVYACRVGPPESRKLAVLFKNISERVRAEDERKQAEEALRESESRLRLILESAKDYAIFTLDLNGTIASWNSGAERLLGYTEAEAIGCSGQIIFTPEDNPQERAAYEMRTAIAQGRATNERWHIRKDGRRFWASGLMMPLLDEAGHPQGFVNIMQDMTAERQADERLQLLYETANDLLSAEQPLVLMNSLFSKLSGQMDLQFYIQYSIEPANNRSILQLISSNGIAQEVIQPIQQLEMGEAICGCVAQEQHQIVVNDLQHSTLPNAQILKPMGVTAYASQPLIVQGRLIGTLAFGSFTRTGFTAEEAALLQAISDQVAVAIERANLTASLRQQTEQLSQANRIKDEFLAVLSHELRTPLNPILGWSKLLRTKKYDEATVDRALETIERNAQLQTQLIEDLLDVSRILQGKLSLNVSPVNLVSTVQAAIETVRLAAEAKSIQIQTAIEPNVGQVSGDTNRLQQVAWNLLSNAVKFTPPGGQVDIRLERHNNQAQITVSDTGKGIAPEFLPYVFDHFRQADSATTRKFGGLGLGLAIVRQIVELHGGTVLVESPGEGQGATFKVRLPLLNSQPAQKPDQPVHVASNQSSLSGLRILVVDDEADSRNFITFVLEQAQAQVMALSSALEAVQELERYKPDVLVSDIGMPDMDGYMLLRQVRSLSPDQGGQVLAIALTAYAGEIDQQQALQAGFQRHLSKPIDPQQLVEAICTLPERRAGEPLKPLASDMGM